MTVNVLKNSTTNGYICYECGKSIKGEHVMTVDEQWFKNGGFGTPPSRAIVHLCSKPCEKKHFGNANKK